MKRIIIEVTEREYRFMKRIKKKRVKTWKQLMLTKL